MKTAATIKSNMLVILVTKILKFQDEESDNLREDNSINI